MKRLIMSLAFFCLIHIAFGQETGIRFTKDLSWAQIKAKAKQEHKYIFVDVYATWCAPCRTMDEVTYPSVKAGVFFNDKFISLKVQADQTEGDSEGIKSWYVDAKRMVADYNVSGFPALLFFSPEGKLVNKSIGWTNDEGLIEIAGHSLDPAKQFYTRLRLFKEGKLSASEIPALANAAKSAGEIQVAREIADKYINDYLLKLPQNKLLTRDNLLFMSRFLGSDERKAFRYFIQHKEKINHVLGYYQAEYAVMNQIADSHIPKADSWKTAKLDWDILEKELSTRYGPLGKEVVYSQRMYYYFNEKDWNMYGIWYQKYLEIAFKHPRYDINFLSWELFKQVEDAEVLSFACDVVMKYAIEEWYQNDPAAYDTYGNLLHKTGRTPEAIKWEAYAVKLKKGQVDAPLYTTALEKMKKGIPTWNTSVNN